MPAHCSHRWSLRDVRTPFSGLVSCQRCGSVVRVSLDAGQVQSTLSLLVLSYGEYGLSVQDLESILIWLGHQLQLEELPELATARAVRHRKRKRSG